MAPRAPYRTVLVDDEPLALKRLSRLLEDFPNVEVIGQARDVETAVRAIEQGGPDLLLLDIDLPGGDGFEVLRRIPRPPLVIFTTGHDQYALRAFEAASIDYLLKPIEADRLARAIGKLERFTQRELRSELESQLRALMSSLQPADPKKYVRRMTVRIGERALLLDIGDVTYFAAKDKYVFLHTSSKEYIIDSTLAELESQLDPKQFVRVHRSTIVNVDKIQEIQDWFGGKYRLVLRDEDNTMIVVSKGMTPNLRAVVPF